MQIKFHIIIHMRMSRASKESPSTKFIPESDAETKVKGKIMRTFSGKDKVIGMGFHLHVTSFVP